MDQRRGTSRNRNLIQQTNCYSTQPTSHATPSVHIPSDHLSPTRSTRSPDVTRPPTLADPFSMVEHSRPHALLRPRLPFKLATFNVRTLMQIGQQAGLAHSLETLGIDVCCLSETRLQDTGTCIRLNPPANPNSVFNIRLSGDPISAASGQAGTGIALSARAEAALLDWIPINSRLCAVRLSGSCKTGRHRGKTRDLFVISAYAPTDCSTDAVKDSFYHNLHELLHSARRSDIIILAGDFNARVGRLSPDELNLGGPYGLEHDRSDNGERLLKLCCDHRLYLASLNFRRSKRRLATWCPPSPSQGLSQIDHIAISFRWRGSIQNCRSYWSTSVDSDHALVCATICMRFGGKPKSNYKHMNTSKLANPEIGEKYRQLLTNSLTVEHSDSLEGRWSRLRTACLTAAMEVCGTTQRRHQTWISTESIRLLDSQRSLTDPMQTAAKRELRRELRQSLRKDREKWWVERAREMEIASLCGNTRRLFQLIRATGIKRPPVSETIQESDGTTINNMSRRINRWAEHFSAQFNQPRLHDVESLEPPDRSWPVSLEPPTEVEVRAVILSLKRHKAPGSDNLPAELLREGVNAIIDELCSLFRIVWVEERIPSSWGESIISPIYKKGDRRDCANYRGISLLPVISKVFASLLLRRLSPHRERTIGEEQAGFRPGRGCVDQIFALRQTLEHRYSYRRPTVIVFLDIRAAFDSVDRAMLWNALLAKGVPYKYVKLLQELYRHTSSQVRVYGTLSQRFAVTSGVRQGCPISPFLFNFAIEKGLGECSRGSYRFRYRASSW